MRRCSTSLASWPAIGIAFVAFVIAAAPAGAQTNFSELYASAKQLAPKVDPNCKGAVSDYTDALKYLYAFAKLAEFNGTLATDEKFRRDVETNLRKVENNVRGCLRLGRVSSSGSFRSDGTEPNLPPPVPPSLPNPPGNMSFSDKSDAALQYWRQRALTPVGTWMVSAGPMQQYLSISSVNGRVSCANMDSLTAVTTHRPCSLRRTGDMMQLVFPDSAYTLSLMLRFDGPDRLIGTGTISAPIGAAIPPMGPPSLVRRQ